MKSKIYIPFFLLALLCTSCLDDPDCTSVTTNFANVKFYLKEDNSLDKVFINSLTALGDDNDSLLISNKEVSAIMLPLNPNEDTTAFLFDTEEYGVDTLVLSYLTTFRLISDDCGLQTFYSKLSHNNQPFDSIAIASDELGEEITENVKIFN